MKLVLVRIRIVFYDVIRHLRDAFGRDRSRFAWPWLGFAVSSMTCVTVMSVIGGLESQVTQQFRDLGVNSMVVSGRPAGLLRERPPLPLTLTDYESVQRRLTASVTVAPVVSLSGSVRACSRTRLATIVGTTSAWRPVAASTLAQGRFLIPPEDAEASAVCVLGSAVAKDLNCVDVGDVIVVSGRPCEVIGILGASRSFDLIDHTDGVFIPVKRVRAVGDLPAAMMLVDAGDRRQASLAREVVRRELRLLHRLMPHMEDDFDMREQTDLLAGYQAVFASVRQAALLIVSLLVLLATVVLVVSLNAGVRERIREIGLLRCVGAPIVLVKAEVLGEALAVAAIGAACGNVAAVGLGAALSRMANVPVVIRPITILTCWAVLVVTGVGAAAWPARRASRLSPWDSLRTE
jgi:putative ABC transport system permease protein